LIPLNLKLINQKSQKKMHLPIQTQILNFQQIKPIVVQSPNRNHNSIEASHSKLLNKYRQRNDIIICDFWQCESLMAKSKTKEKINKKIVKLRPDRLWTKLSTTPGHAWTTNIVIVWAYLFTTGLQFVVSINWFSFRVIQLILLH